MSVAVERRWADHDPWWDLPVQTTTDISTEEENKEEKEAEEQDDFSRVVRTGLDRATIERRISARCFAEPGVEGAGVKPDASMESKAQGSGGRSREAASARLVLPAGVEVTVLNSKAFSEEGEGKGGDADGDDDAVGGSDFSCAVEVVLRELGAGGMMLERSVRREFDSNGNMLGVSFNSVERFQ